MAQYRENGFNASTLEWIVFCFVGVACKVARCFSGLLDMAAQFRSMFQILMLEDIGFGHREHQYIFLHGIVWAWSTGFQTIRKIIRQSNINNCTVQCAGTNRSSLVVHHNAVGMYGRCLTLFEGVDSVLMTYGA